MKILVLSDSHGYMEHLYAAVRQEMPDLICHLGDHSADAEQLRREFWKTPLLSVPGNCDFPAIDESLSRITQEQGIRILLTHGHQYGVKQGLLRLLYAAREADCQVALFGHTHVPHCSCEGGVWLLNPGSCMGHLRYGVVKIEKGHVLCYNHDTKE